MIAELAFDGSGQAELFAMYFDHAAVSASALAGAVAAGDAPVIATRAHELKGASAMIGASRVAGYASELEASAKAGDLDPAPRLLDSLNSALAETITALADPPNGRRGGAGAA
jgi:HPt (histidine-containing phosphotransfer) domain-containing protein